MIDRAAILGDGRRLDIGKALGVNPGRPATPVNGVNLVPAPASPPPERYPNGALLTLDEAVRALHARFVS